MTYSILHRVTGVGLAVGALLIPITLFFVVMGQDYFAAYRSALFSPIGWVFLAGWTWCFYYHFLGGIRHLIWHAGGMLSRRAARLSGHLYFLLSVVLTIGTLWCLWGRV